MLFKNLLLFRTQERLEKAISSFGKEPTEEVKKIINPINNFEKIFTEGNEFKELIVLASIFIALSCISAIIYRFVKVKKNRDKFDRKEIFLSVLGFLLSVYMLLWAFLPLS